MAEPCLHPHGDMVDGYWLCGRCYSKLAEQPVRYLKGKSINGGEYHIQIPVYAEIRKAYNGWTLSQFIEAMARRLMAKAGFSKADAISYAIDLLRSSEIEFGAGDYAWDTEAAWEFISEDMQYWDQDGGSTNG